MPFMRGPAPIRRTIDYLKSGKLIFNNQVRIFTLNYNVLGDRHLGVREFVFWELPKLQYMNPNVQIATFLNMNPLPYIRAYMDNGREMLIDVDNRTQGQILDHLIAMLGKSETAVDRDFEFEQRKNSPANFGVGCMRPCICEVRGQVPCPGVLQLPKQMRGKYKYFLKEELASMKK